MNVEVLPERFREKFIPEPMSGCWIWIGACTSSGYGNIALGKRRVLSHRVAYELLVGQIPEGLQLDHLCRNRACVNPNHLEPVTQAENSRRSPLMGKFNRHKTHCLRGHAFSAENTYRQLSNGKRYCRTCGARRAREKYRRVHGLTEDQWRV